MNFAGLIFLIIAHFLCGRGFLRLFKLQLSPLHTICLSFMVGVPLLSFSPCFVQLFGIPITKHSIGISAAIFTALFCIPIALNFKRPRLGKIALPEIYEWPFLLICFGLVFLSVWRCFYYPPTSRDMLAGPELLAEFAVREKTMLSSVFTLDLHTTNNYFKSPYITCLQIMYKLLVLPFGQLWMSVLYVPFVVFIYSILRQRVHPFLASLLLFLFMAIPDLFAYSFVMLYDYSNMVFFFCGFYFLVRHLEEKRLNDFVFSAFLFGLATYIRVETIVLVTMLSIMPLYNFYKERIGVKNILLRLGLMIGVPGVFYIICIHVFVRNFVPIPFHATNDLNPHLADVSYFFQRVSEMISVLIIGHQGIVVYGYFIVFFLVLAVADVLFVRQYNRESRFALFGVLVIFFGLPFLGYLLPLFDINNTTKRGLFKAIPLMLFYMCNSGIIQKLSGQLYKWESDKKEEKAKVKAVPVAKAAIVAKPANKANTGIKNKKR